MFDAPLVAFKQAGDGDGDFGHWRSWTNKMIVSRPLERVEHLKQGGQMDAQGRDFNKEGDAQVEGRPWMRRKREARGGFVQKQQIDSATIDGAGGWDCAVGGFEDEDAGRR